MSTTLRRTGLIALGLSIAAGCGSSTGGHDASSPDVAHETDSATALDSSTDSSLDAAAPTDTATPTDSTSGIDASPSPDAISPSPDAISPSPDVVSPPPDVVSPMDAGRDAATPPDASRTDSAAPDASPARHILWGAWMHGSVYNHLTGGSGYSDSPYDLLGYGTQPGATTLFETHAGKHVSVIHFGSPFHSSSNCGGDCAFSAAAFNAVEAHGAVPLFDWGTWSGDGGYPVTQPAYSNAQIASGAHDAYIRAWAMAAHAWGHRIVLRLDWEMNLGGCQWPWQEGCNGNAAGSYAAMWRHVHDVFVAAGATNVEFLWCPNREYTGSRMPLAGFYPGDAYVERVGIDAYNHPGDDLSFDALVGPTYTLITGTIAPGKPFTLGEFATDEGATPAKPGWITDALTRIRSSAYSRIDMIAWWEGDGDGRWYIESSSGAQSAFATGIANAAYVAGM